MRFVDSHLHLGEEGAWEHLRESAATDTLLVTCGTDRKTSLGGVTLAKASPERLKAFVGVHPSEAEKSKGAGWLERGVAESDGVGEIGLDPSYSTVGPRSAQMKLFIAQVEVAQNAGKPVQVHSRGAEKAAIEALDGFRLKGVLMHWFEKEELVQEVLGRGYFVSFGPAILYSKRLQRMAAKAPPGQVLTETDSPVPYGPLRGAYGPSLVPSVVFKLAQLWGTSFQEARGYTVAGAVRVLGLSSKG